MAKILIIDLFEELSEENNRLLNELIVSKKFVELLENYRKCLLDFNNHCNCDQNINYKLKLNQLEYNYKTFNKKFDKKLDLNENSLKGKQTVQSLNKQNLIQCFDITPKIENDSNDESNIGCVTTARSDGLEEPYTREEVVDTRIDFGNQFVVKEEINIKSEELDTGSDWNDNKCEQRFNKSVINEQKLNEEFGTNSENRIRYRSNGLKSLKELICNWDDCGKQFSDRDRLLAHICTHTKPFSCSECDKRFGSRSNQMRHRNECHLKIIRKHSCDWIGCSAQFVSKTRLMAHIRSKHTNEKPFKCTECDKYFVDKRGLDRHKWVNHSNPIKLKCSYNGCQYETPEKGLLEKHKSSHSVVRPFKCDQNGCEKRFKTKVHLNKHNREVHITSRSFRCEWPGCEAAFKMRRSLDHHYKYHSNDRKFVCDISGCDKSFIDLICLTRHKTTHDKVKRFRCIWPGCEKTFTHKDSLTGHQNRHQNIRFNCDSIGCDKSFLTQLQLGRHVKNSHK